MPDLLLVFSNRWKLVTAITLCATVLALIIAMLSPKKYLSTATALPVNSVTADKARIFNSNIEALYSDFGTPDELDRLEGTARLDTIFIAASEKFNL
ncbi:MAG: Wzz/FepE/Etk N-terminal domain-containing protein, partial [Flavisolibacter sp.]